MTTEPARRVLMTADAVGGVWTYALELARGLAPHGVEIALATMGPLPSTPQRREVAKLENVTLYPSEYALEWTDGPWREVDAAGEWLLETAALFQPDLIHLNGYAHAALPWEAPALVVAHSCVGSWWRAIKDEALPASFGEYARRVAEGLEAADLVIAPTGAMLAALEEEYGLSAPGVVIPNGRSARHFTPAAKQPVIVSGGRLWDEAKNIALLEQIAPELAWPVRIAGSFAATGDAAPAKSVGCDYLGQLAPAKLARLLATAGIYAAPALYEPFGLGILEAALCGCALVLSDLPSLRENWEGAAVFVSPREREEWRETLNALAADNAQRARLSREARKRAREFTPERMAQAYAAAYARMLGSVAADREEALAG